MGVVANTLYRVNQVSDETLLCAASPREELCFVRSPLFTVARQPGRVKMMVERVMSGGSDGASLFGLG